MGMSIQGQLHKKFETKQVSASFRKREFVVEYKDNPMYPQYILFQLIQDKTEQLDKFQEGSAIQVEFDLRGREWTSPQGEIKYFNSLDAWRVTEVQVQAGMGSTPPPPMPPDVAINATNLEEDDLPF